MKLINKITEAVVKAGVGASSQASAVTTHEPKRPSKLK